MAEEGTGIAPAEAAEIPEPAPGEQQAPAVQTTEPVEIPGSEPSLAGEQQKAGEPDPQASKDSVQRRIDRLTWEKSEYKRRAEHLERQLLQRPSAPTPTPAVPAAEEPPKPEAFDDYNQYLIASARYEARKEIREQQARQEESKQQTQNQEWHDNQQRKIIKTIQTGREKFEDFDEYVTPELPISDAMLHAVAETGKGPEIMYFMGRNPQETARIASLPILAQAVEIGKIEERLGKPKQTTNAPPPIPASKGAGAPVQKELKDMTQDEYSEERRRRKKAGTW